MRFERVASYEGWEIDSYGVHLSTLLTGNARDVYCRLPLALANDYGYLKKVLLAKYQLTETITGENSSLLDKQIGKIVPTSGETLNITWTNG